MSDDYQKLLAIPLFFVTGYLYDTSPYYYTVYIFLVVGYISFKQSTLFQQSSLSKNYYFLKSKKDDLRRRKELIGGIISFLGALLVVLLKEKLALDEFMHVTILSSLLALGVAGIVSKLFLTPNPIYALVIRGMHIDVLKHTNELATYHGITGFEVSADRLLLQRNGNQTELDGLVLSEADLQRVGNALVQAQQLFEKELNTRQEGKARLLKYFRLK